MVIVPDLSLDSSIGIWSYILSIKTGLRFGSMYPYFERAHKKGYATVIINPNATPDTILPFEHIKSVFRFLLKKTKCQSLLILACGESIKNIISSHFLHIFLYLFSYFFILIILFLTYLIN